MPLAAYTASSGITLPVPHLAQASRKLAVDAAEAIATSLELSPPPDGATPIRVEPGRRTPLTLAFTDIAGPGRYDATLRFVAEGYKPLDAKVVMFVREPASLALFFVFLGVLISFLIQLWGTAIRPARELRQRVAALMEPVAAARRQADAAASAADPEVLLLLDGVEAGLQQRASATWYERPRIAASLDVYDAIVAALKPWISAWSQLNEVQPESVRAAHRATLRDVRQQFVTRSPDAVQVAASVRSLELLPEKIRADVAAALGAAIDELAQSIAGDPRAGMVKLRARLRSAAERLAGGQVEAAIGVYQQALRDYTIDMANLLRQRVDPAAPVPPGLDPAEWQALKKETLEALDAGGLQDVETALARLREATAVYVQGFAASLRRAMAKKPPAERQAVDDAAKKVDLAVGNHDLVGAWAALGEVQDAYAQAQTLVGQPMGDDRLGALVAATRAPGGTLDAQAGFDLPGWWASLSQPGAAARIGRRTLWGDLAVSLVVLVLAGLTGVQTLWVPNPVWGGPTAYLAALLLGFAADRFTQAAVAAFRR
ncbi:MAG TPA: hypothetical protein VLJ62_28450 [Burkholderiaceae bacterium]|nr:hypothetical protein [Burkholderiaceae bacterium]